MAMFEMGLAGAGQHGLMGLVVAAHDQRRVLLLEAVEGGHQLVLVGLALGVDGDRQHRQGGFGDPVAGRTGRQHRDGHIARRQGVAGVRGGELCHGSDIAGGHLGERELFFASQREKRVETLLGLSTSG